MADEATKQTVEVVFLGKHNWASGWRNLFITKALLVPGMTREQVLQLGSAYKPGKGDKARVIGGVYSVEAQVDEGNGRVTVIWSHTLAFTGKRVEHEVVPLLEAEVAADEMRAKRDAQEKRIRANSVLMTEADALRRTYSALNYSDKVAFEWALLTLLRRP